MSPIVLIIVILLLFGGIGFAPSWGWNSGRSWGWGPSGGIVGLLVLLLILRLLGII